MDRLDSINFNGIKAIVLDERGYSRTDVGAIGLDQERDKDYIALALKVKELRLNPKKVSAALTFLLSMDLY